MADWHNTKMSHDTRAATPLRSPALGGSDIGRCFTRIHHDRFTPAARTSDDVRDRALAAGIAFEDSVLEAIAATGVRWTAIPRGPEAGAATLAALDAGMPVVLGALLTGDDGALVGYPDLLVRLPGGYGAVDVKHHKVIGDRGPEALRSPLDALADHGSAEEVRFRSFRRRDLLQVAHYWSLLSTTGHATPTATGGIIGTDQPLGCLWVDLAAGDAPVMDEYTTYVEDARAAITHGMAGGEPLHRPWMRGECRRCDWRPWCMAELESVDDPTLLRDVDHDTRSALAERGVTTIRAVAELDPAGDPTVEGSTVFQARARTHGRLLRSDPADGPLPLPDAPVEVDFDIETYGGVTYLAGLLTTVEGRSSYDPVVDWRGTADGERQVLGELFERFASWDPADVIVYHWTDYERRVMTNAAARHGLSISGHESVDAWFDACAFDLCDWARNHLVSPDGFSLKTVAPLCGFHWRDDDPGGLQSEVWFERLRDGDSDMDRRLRMYNEDDVLAQLAVRRWVRRHDDGSGPGSTIASVTEWPITT
jgi:hypothetical protein